MCYREEWDQISISGIIIYLKRPVTVNKIEIAKKALDILANCYEEEKVSP